MSYILDALRRAEAERDRGQVPGLHAQPVSAAASMPQRQPSAGARWLLPAVTFAGIAVAAWWLWPGAAVQAPAQQQASTAAAVDRRPVVSATPSPTPAAAPAPLPIVVSAPPPPPAPPPAAPAPPVVRDPPADTTGARSPDPPGQRPVPATVDARGAAAVGQPPPESRPVPLSRLAPEQRREWPPLVVGGVVHSDNAASRFLIIDGQLVHEGESVAPGISVERIGPRSAVLRGRAGRVEISY